MSVGKGSIERAAGKAVKTAAKAEETTVKKPRKASAKKAAPVENIAPAEGTAAETAAVSDMPAPEVPVTEPVQEAEKKQDGLKVQSNMVCELPVYLL